MLLANNKGFSLVEVIVSVGIFAMISVAIAELFLFSWRGSRIVWEQLSTQNEGRKAVQDFVSEIRTANYSSIGAFPLATTSANEIIFYANIDDDTLRERIHYYLQDTILKKGVTKPTGTPMTYPSADDTVVDIVHDVANQVTPVFSYYDVNYTGSQNALAAPINPSSVRMVQIKLRMEEDPNLSPAPFNVEGKAMLRNLKDN